MPKYAQEHLERLPKSVGRVVGEIVEGVPEARLLEHLQGRACHPSIDIDHATILANAGFDRSLKLKTDESKIIFKLVQQGARTL